VFLLEWQYTDELQAINWSVEAGISGGYVYLAEYSEFSVTLDFWMMNLLYSLGTTALNFFLGKFEGLPRFSWIKALCSEII
jgi:hypothetical protein